MHPTTTPQRSLLALAAGALALMALSGCGPDKPTSADGYLPTPGSASAARSATASANSTEKFNGYVRVHDILVGGAGLGSTRRSYESAVLSARYKGASVTFSKGWIDTAITELKKARAVQATDYPALDAAADKLLQTLEPLQRTLVEVDVYYSSKAYLEDDFAKAKGRYATTLVAFNVADDASDAFDVELEKITAALATQRLETLKERGDMLAYDLALAMSQAKQLLRTVRDSAAASAKLQTKASSKPAPFDFTGSDPIMQSLEKTLTDGRAEHEKRKATADPTLTGSSYSEQAYVLDALTQMVGSYRAFRASREQRDGESLFRYYNQAVDFYNRIPTRQYQILPRK